MKKFWVILTDWIYAIKIDRFLKKNKHVDCIGVRRKIYSETNKEAFQKLKEAKLLSQHITEKAFKFEESEKLFIPIVQNEEE